MTCGCVKKKRKKQRRTSQHVTPPPLPSITDPADATYGRCSALLRTPRAKRNDTRRALKPNHSVSDAIRQGVMSGILGVWSVAPGRMQQGKLTGSEGVGANTVNLEG